MIAHLTSEAFGVLLIDYLLRYSPDQARRGEVKPGL
jgi:hypothetical protein